MGVGATFKEPPGGGLKLTTEMNAIYKKIGAPPDAASSQEKQGGTSKDIAKDKKQETPLPSASLSSEKSTGYLEGIFNTVKDAAVVQKDGLNANLKALFNKLRAHSTKDEKEETPSPSASLSSKEFKGYWRGIVNTVKDAAVFVQNSSLSSPDENQKLRLTRSFG